ncbi:MAG: hypothetical protein FWD13_06955 [Treponema sp.]|nr:hypothetical protein [Treponema sp.]
MPIIEADMSKFLNILLISFIVIPVYGLDLPVSQITDDSHLRLRLHDTWLIETPNRVLAQRPRIELLETGERVRVSTIEGRLEFMVLLSREQTRGSVVTDTSPAVPRRANGQFPGWAQGSWMLTRRKDTGAGTQIRIFLRSDQNTHSQFRPLDEDKCLLDVVLYGGYIARSIPVPVTFERLYTMQLNDILRLVENKFQLRYFEPDIASYRDNRRFVAQVRSRLGNLSYVDDGAIDENGRYVLIDNLRVQNQTVGGLNCSGFAKWLIDGILRPVTGRRLPITPLKTPFGERGSDFTANWEERRAPFFGLDWIRNLAAEANGTLRSPAYRSLDEFEIRYDNFSHILVNQNRTFVTHSYPGFMRDAGYGFEGLHPLLYTLAIDEPFSFYLAAINNEISTPTSPRGTPRLRQYYHVAALIPYFDEHGDFRIVVFESAAETSFNTFRNRYPNQFINLVKIPVSPHFDP